MIDGHRHLMYALLGFAGVCAVASFKFIFFVKKYDIPKGNRYVYLVQSTIMMCIAWALVFAGKAFFMSIGMFENDKENIFAGMFLALGLSVLVFSVTLILDKIVDSDLYDNDVDYAIVQIIMSLGFGVGFCWEEAFDTSVEILAEQTLLPTEPVKLCLAVCTCLVIIPTYRMHIVSTVFPLMKQAEQMLEGGDAQGHEEGMARHLSGNLSCHRIIERRSCGERWSTGTCGDDPNTAGKDHRKAKGSPPLHGEIEMQPLGSDVHVAPTPSPALLSVPECGMFGAKSEVPLPLEDKPHHELSADVSASANCDANSITASDRTADLDPKALHIASEMQRLKEKVWTDFMAEEKVGEAKKRSLGIMITRPPDERADRPRLETLMEARNNDSKIGNRPLTEKQLFRALMEAKAKHGRLEALLEERRLAHETALAEWVEAQLEAKRPKAATKSASVGRQEAESEAAIEADSGPTQVKAAPDANELRHNRRPHDHPASCQSPGRLEPERTTRPSSESSSTSRFIGKLVNPP